MEYGSFANELIKVSAPALAAQALLQQQKSDKEFQDLMDSTKPNAVPKAFTKGFTAGLAVPAFISANMFLSSKGSVAAAERGARQIHIAEALRSFKVPDPAAAAAALDRVVFSPLGDLRATAHLTENLIEARLKMDQHIVSGAIPIESIEAPSRLRHNAFTQEMNRLKNLKKGQITDEGLAEMTGMLRKKYYTIQGGKVLPSSTALHPPQPIGTAEEIKGLEEIGRNLYKKRVGREASVAKRYIRDFGRYMARSSKIPLMLGAIIGGFGAKGVFSKRKKLKDLQAAARRRKK